MLKKVAILANGGDVSGFNAVIRAIVKTAEENGIECYGFIDNINEYIAASAIVLTKPGGLTSTEVATLRKPMIHIMPIPGVENYNARFFEKNGLSLVSNSIEEVLTNTNKLLKDKNLQKSMIENQAKIINKNSANDLVNFVLTHF